MYSSPSLSPIKHRGRHKRKSDQTNNSSSTSSNKLSRTIPKDGWLTTRKSTPSRRTYKRVTDPDRDDRYDANALDEEYDIVSSPLDANKHETTSTCTFKTNRQHTNLLPSRNDSKWMSSIRLSKTVTAASSSPSITTATAAANNTNSSLRNLDGGHAPSNTNDVLPLPPESPDRKQRASNELHDENESQQSPQYRSPLPRSRQEEEYDGSPDLLLSSDSEDDEQSSLPTSTTTNRPSVSTNNRSSVSTTTTREKLDISPLELPYERDIKEDTSSTTTQQQQQQASSASATLHTCSNNNGSCACLGGTFLPSAAVQQQWRPFKFADISSIQETAKITSVLRDAQENASQYTPTSFWGGKGRRDYTNNAQKDGNINKYTGKFKWTPTGKKKCEFVAQLQGSPTLCAFAVNISSFILRNTVANPSVKSWTTFSDACLTDIFVMRSDVSVTDVTTIRGKIPTIAAAAQIMIADMNTITKKYRDTNILDAAQEERYNTVVTFLEQLVNVRYDYVELRTAEDLPLLPWEDTPIDDVLPPLDGSLMSLVGSGEADMLATRQKSTLGQFKRTTATAEDAKEKTIGKGTTVGDEGCACMHCDKKFFSGNGEKMKKNFETLTTHLLKECTECDDDTKSALKPAGWQSKNRTEHTQINEKYGDDVLGVWVKLCGQKADKEAYIRQYVHDLVEEFKEVLSKRRDIKLHPKHIPVHDLLQQEDVLKLIVMIHRWISMSDSEREAVGLDDIVSEATKVGVDLKDIWPDLREKYDHHLNHSSRSKGEFMKSAVHKIIRVLQKYCAGCGMDLAAMLSTGLKEAFRGCDQDHMFDNVCRVLGDDERTKKKNVSHMNGFSLEKLLRELIFSAITCFLCHDRRAGSTSTVQHPNLDNECRKVYPKMTNVVSLSKIISGGAEDELDAITNGSGVLAFIDDLIKSGTGKVKLETLEVEYETASGGMSIYDNSFWTKPDFVNASQMHRTLYLKKTLDNTFKRKAGCCALCKLDFRRLPVKKFQGGDLHHINELLKRYDPSAMRGYNVQNKADEFSETVLLCKPCHQEITYDAAAMSDFMNDLFNAGVIDEEGNIIH